MGKADELIELIRLAASRAALRRLILSKPIGAAEDLPKRISARLTERRGRRVLFFEEAYDGGRVSQFALSTEELSERLSPLIASFGQIDLLTSAGDAVLLRSRRGTETLRGGKTLAERLSADEGQLSCELTPLLGTRRSYLTGSEPFLIALGISDARGRVHDKKQGKFRQINRFLEYVEDTVAGLPMTPVAKEKPLLIYDLCSGKSYLSFALYHYLTVICGRRVAMLAMDLKSDVMRFCADVAEGLGFSERREGDGWHGMRFLGGDIRNLPRGEAPDLVISLHACDIATDLVLGLAISRGARAILSTPCCHRTLDRYISASELSFVTRHPKLRGKLAEAATDALRSLRLEAAGYSVTAAEHVDPDDTPKNTILVARLRSGPRPKKRAEYLAALRFLLGDSAEDYLKEIGDAAEKTDRENTVDRRN
jgi:hypothetical protein